MPNVRQLVREIKFESSSVFLLDPRYYLFVYLFICLSILLLFFKTRAFNYILYSLLVHIRELIMGQAQCGTPYELSLLSKGMLRPCISRKQKD